jgi:DNA polymerase-3 subunit alpha
MAANMSAVMDDTDKVQQLYQDAKENGLAVLPPDINQSEYRFVPVDHRTIRYGLGGVKGTGEAAVQSIVGARRDRPFSDLFDFCCRVDKRLVNRRAVEALVRAGAFDALKGHRAQLLASVDRALSAADQAERGAGQGSLFGEADGVAALAADLVVAPMWDERTRLQEEKAALGFYVSGHPFSMYREELRRVAPTALASVQPRAEPVMLAGVVASARTQMTRRGKMGVILLDDQTAQLEIMVFSELFDLNHELIRQDRPLVVHGKVQRDEFSGGVRVTAEKLFDLAAVRIRYGKELRLCMNGEADAKRLHQVLAPFRNGTLPVAIDYQKNGAVCVARLGDDWRITPDEQLIADLREWLHPENVTVVYG